MAGAVRRFLAPEFASTRRLLLELHGAGQRHPDMAQLLGSWHAERAGDLEATGMTAVGVQALYLTLLGCCQLEAVVPAAVSRRRLEAAMIAAAEAAVGGTV